MDKLKQALMPILKEIKSRYSWVFEAAEFEYLTQYFHKLGRPPNLMEIILCMRLSHPQPYKTSPKIPGHKMDVFYAQPTVIETTKPNLLDTPEIPSDAKLNDPSLDKMMLDEEEAARARTLMANSTPLPNSVVSLLEDRYWIENRYTHQSGYHHYEHLEGESRYELFFNSIEKIAAFTSRTGFIGIKGHNLQSMLEASEGWINYANLSGFPFLCSWFYAAENARCFMGGFSNILSYEDETKKIKPGDRLFLLGKPSIQREAVVENQFRSIIFNAYALLERNPISRVFYLENQSLFSAILESLRSSEEGLGVFVNLALIPKLYTQEFFEDIWVQPLQSACLVIVPDYQKHIFHPIIERENCACIEIGEITELLNVTIMGNDPKIPLVDLPLDFIENFPYRLITSRIDSKHFKISEPQKIDSSEFGLKLEHMLQSLPVSDKSVFFSQIDRTSTGLVARDPMVGPWQVPVADVAVTLTEFKDYLGEAISVSHVQLLEKDQQLSVMRALNEAITNLAAAAIENLSDVQLLIPKGILSLDMEQQLKSWVELLGIRVHDQEFYESFQGMFFLMAFAPVLDVRKTLTPQWVTDDETELMGIVWDGETQDNWKSFFGAIQTLNRDDLLLSYHDISKGGLARCLLEMAFSSHCGFSVNLTNLSPFKQYAGAVIQIRRSSKMEVADFLSRAGFNEKIYWLGRPISNDQVIFRKDKTVLFTGSLIHLHRVWSKPSYDLQKIKGDSVSAQEAYDVLLDSRDPGLHETLTFDPSKNIILPYISEEKPPMAILRFPGTPGHLELAATFDRVGFECIDVSIIDILNGKDDLQHYKGLSIGGCEVKDLSLVKFVFQSSLVKHVFEQFFRRKDTFTLGVGMGCWWLTQIKDWIPGAMHWPSCAPNVSSRFENRWSLITIKPSNSIFLKDMEASFIPMPIACSEGRFNFSDVEILRKGEDQQLFPLAYANHYEQITEQYPFNPTGSPLGVCAFTNQDGRVLGVMGHPERAHRAAQQAWRHRYLQRDAAWLRLFRNARKFVG